MKLRYGVIAATLTFSIAGCATAPPKEPENLCRIFEEKRDWYKAAAKMEKKWGVPIQVPMAIMYQESSFKHNAKPPRDYILWVIPWGRVSSAYGYSQAKTGTWDDYVKETGNSWSSRDNFNDAMDFMGWYISKSHRINGVSKWDAYAQYLNYHEGWGGYKRQTYRQKQWLMRTAERVQERAGRYGAQLRQCEEDLQRGWLWRLFFG
ncbi:transglycosylase SLT domain-containing protein [Pseudidiomarina indica]|nr:transglycosylase SLT domain-containing protein [Pseudidiomarina indica]